MVIVAFVRVAFDAVKFVVFKFVAVTFVPKRFNKVAFVELRFVILPLIIFELTKLSVNPDKVEITPDNAVRFVICAARACAEAEGGHFAGALHDLAAPRAELCASA